MKTKVTLALILLFIEVSFSHSFQKPAKTQEQHVSKERRFDSMKALVRAVASSEAEGVRIEYRGTCDPSNSEQINPPSIDLRQTSASLSGANKLRAMLSLDRDASVTQSGGIIRIKLNRVAGDILDTNIKTLTLTPNQQYNPRPAIWAFENDKQIQNALSRLNARFALSLGGLETLPSPNLPHLEPTMSHLTFDEALDRVARAFSGIVVYKECVRPGKTTLVSIDFDRY